MKRQALISLLILLTVQTFAAAKVRRVPRRKYPTIQDAINAAKDGDVVVVAPGVYTGPGNVDLDFQGKAITVRSKINPDKPDWDIIAATIIDCQGNKYEPHRAFYFRNGEGADSKVLGFTIRNGYATGPAGARGEFGYIGEPVDLFVPIPPCDDPCDCPPYALNGDDASGDGYGGAILCAGASPTIKYCVITNCTITGAQGGDGAPGLNGTWYHWTLADFNEVTGMLNPDAELTENTDGQWGGHGGSGSGTGYGGAIACLAGSNPIISDCIISNNFAHGGCGGDGGNGGNAKEPPDYSEGNEGGGGDGGTGYGDGIGGAIYCNGGSSPTITNCTFSNNIATTGTRATGGVRGKGNETDPRAPAGAYGWLYPTGGIAGGAVYYDTGSNPNFTNCIFSGNEAYEVKPWFDFYYFYYYAREITLYTVGGALYSVTNNTITLDTCEFIDNLGGAVYCETGCDLKLDTCSFHGNSDPKDGGDLLVDTGIDTGSGGAVYVGSGGSVDIQNSIFGGNSAKNDGGALKCKSNANITNCSFGSNVAYGGGGAFTGYGGAIDAFDDELHATLTLDVNNCSFSGNQALFGGSFSSENFIATFTDCYFIGNIAERGGGLDLVYGDVSITDGVINANNATDCGGGGLNCASTKAEIRDCTITNNVADGAGASGGAIRFDGSASMHLVKNCLIAGNSATISGGAIDCYSASPDVNNCTFSDNSAGSYGGAIFSSWGSFPQIIDSIFQNCTRHAIYEEDGGGDAIVTFCLFYSNPHGDYYDSGTGLTYTGAGEISSIPGGSHNLYGDPLFVSGPLGDFYLSQIAAGQSGDSPAVDEGSDTAANLGFDTYTTRIDSVGDAGQIDIGYHYIDAGIAGTFQLTASVIGGHGTIEPESGEYYTGTIASLTATPDSGWRVKAWSGTDNDASTAKTNTVVMNSDRTVTVKFEQPRTLIVAVGGGAMGYYSNIQDALHDANDGDTIVVYSGTYYGPQVQMDKSVEIRSKHPDDPCYVAATIIDSTGHAGPVFWFSSATDAGTILNGFTIQNSTWFTDVGDDGEEPSENGEDGASAEGGAIFISPDASPIIKNCVVRDNSILGGFGGHGHNADDTHNAGRGGWGGWARGGAVYCGTNSSPTFINCQIIDNEAVGGLGGNGGDEADPGGRANYGGNWSRAEWWNIDPRDLTVEWVEGDLWEKWDEMAQPGPGQTEKASFYVIDHQIYFGYFGDYRWYSGYGGGVFCNTGSNVTFINCTISGNLAQGGMSGLGGYEPGSGPYRTKPWPRKYEIPSFGGGVYCADNTTVTFTGCTITDNISSDPQYDHRPGAEDRDEGGRLGDDYDPNNTYRIDPYLGHGGGVCAEDTAVVIFTDCIFSENEADVGGAVFWANANPRISDCNFAFNSAFQGGGLFGEHGPATIIGCSITNNEAFLDIDDPNICGEVLGEGGGLHCWATDVNIIDCNISDNRAEASGGGVYFGGESAPSLTNCLITGNTAGRDGGGVSANIFSQLTISNCTIADNRVRGDGFEDSYGGGLYCCYGNYTNIINSILWNNSAENGNQIAIGTTYIYDPRPSTVEVSYSDVQGGAAAVDVDTQTPDATCELIWDYATNLTGTSLSDPCFVHGYLGRYYLSQPDADPNQTDLSPCVDAGSDDAYSLDMYRHTTRTDRVIDADIVDMGYHYILYADILGDFNFDGVVDSDDWLILQLHWFEEDCGFPDWCCGTDLNQDGIVNFLDEAIFVLNYGEMETTPPTPNPMTWAVAPYSDTDTSITMTATTAFDNSTGWDVEYYFECVYGGGSDRDWDPCSTYIDTGLIKGNTYGYRVKARDTSANQNETEWSVIGYAITGEIADFTPPTPDPMTWATLPYATSPNSIAMVATTASDDTSGVEYYFECTAGGGHNSGWQDSTTYEDTGLDFNTTYTYRVRARDKSVNHNKTDWSSELSATTLEEGEEPPPPPDTTPPVTDPNLGEPGRYKSKWAVEPYEHGSGWYIYHSMTAVVATDESEPVEYYFKCSDNRYSSDWQESPSYTVLVGNIGTGFSYKVKTRDSSPNQNEGYYSDELVAD